MEAPSLAALVGSTIVVLIPALHPAKLQQVKLLAIESYGVWIESQAVTEQLLQFAGRAFSPRSAVFFFPWSAMTLVLSSSASPSLSEKAFGV